MSQDEKVHEEVKSNFKLSIDLKLLVVLFSVIASLWAGGGAVLAAYGEYNEMVKATKLNASKVVEINIIVKQLKEKTMELETELYNERLNNINRLRAVYATCKKEIEKCPLK